MANLPNSLSMNAPFGGPGGPDPGGAGAPTGKERRMASAEHLVLELSNPDLREEGCWVWNHHLCHQSPSSFPTSLLQFPLANSPFSSHLFD
ncbi:unnamed protein product [Linum tenue]|uniref:Uncharacterized protein n=1 Tax=Linum tenue TaxID=586396 RepID=A0AAV0QZT7_9ROSI|nr:unnamed protein product [Linum tenue]